MKKKKKLNDRGCSILASAVIRQAVRDKDLYFINSTWFDGMYLLATRFSSYPVSINKARADLTKQIIQNKKRMWYK